MTMFERARRLQAEAAKLGFDWPTLDGIFQKVEEETLELREAVLTGQPQGEVKAELGDLLFVLVNLARRLDVPPGDALAAACNKFERRFAYVCNQLAKSGRSPRESTLDEMETLWREAKLRFT